MKKLIPALAVIFLIASTGYSGDDKKTNTYSSPTAGFSITKPTSWRFASLEQVSAARESVRLKDKDLEKAIREQANVPLLVILKYEEPYPDLNPNVQVHVRSLGQLEGKSATEVLSMTIPALKRVMSDFELVDPVKETTVSGMKAAYMKCKYKVSAGDKEFGVLSRMWLVPRGGFMFMISMDGPQEGPDVSEKEFAQILKSIKIEK